MTKTLNFEALKKRITRTVSTKDALSDVTPFSVGEGTTSPDVKITVDRKDDNVQKERYNID